MKRVHAAMVRTAAGLGLGALMLMLATATVVAAQQRKPVAGPTEAASLVVRGMEAVNRDAFDEALPHFEKACDAGNPWGCGLLGYMYGTGTGVTKHLARAAAFSRRACDGGDADGCGNLARLYGGGTGVPKDPEKAATLMRRACELGQPAACPYKGAGGVWSPWLDLDGARRELDRRVSSGMYPVAVVGRDTSGRTQYRALYAPVPTGDTSFAFQSRIGLTSEEWWAASEELGHQGYLLAHSQHFMPTSRVYTNNGVWIRRAPVGQVIGPATFGLLERVAGGVFGQPIGGYYEINLLDGGTVLELAHSSEPDIRLRTTSQPGVFAIESSRWSGARFQKASLLPDGSLQFEWKDRGRDAEHQFLTFSVRGTDDRATLVVQTWVLYDRKLHKHDSRWDGRRQGERLPREFQSLALAGRDSARKYRGLRKEGADIAQYETPEETADRERRERDMEARRRQEQGQQAELAERSRQDDAAAREWEARRAAVLAAATPPATTPTRGRATPAASGTSAAATSGGSGGGTVSATASNARTQPARPLRFWLQIGIRRPIGGENGVCFTDVIELPAPEGWPETYRAANEAIRPYQERFRALCGEREALADAAPARIYWNAPGDDALHAAGVRQNRQRGHVEIPMR